MTVPPASLPPAPLLDPALLRLERVPLDHGAVIEAYVPAGEAYRCADPRAPALVCLHGLGVSGMSFLRQLPLGGLAELHFPHLPNGPVAGEKGLGHFAHAMEDYILARKLDRRPGGVVLLGTSLGGAVALTLAVRGRVRLRGLVLICTLGSAKHLGHGKRWIAPLAYLIPVRLWHAVGSWMVVHTSRFDRFPPGEGEWMIRGIDLRTRSFLGRSVCAITNFEHLEAARRLAVPTLVVHGREDRILPFAGGLELSQVIPGARLVALEGAGHAVFFVRHEEVNAELAQFLASLQRPAGPAI